MVTSKQLIVFLISIVLVTKFCIFYCKSNPKEKRSDEMKLTSPNVLVLIRSRCNCSRGSADHFTEEDPPEIEAT